jgi:hypothetical protein
LDETSLTKFQCVYHINPKSRISDRKGFALHSIKPNEELEISVITILLFLAFLGSLRIKPRRGGQKLARGGAKRNPWMNMER